MSRTITIGDPAPDLNITAANGSQISLRERRGERAMVVFFYPKDGSPICTAEACQFRDAYEAFVEAGADVIGVSGDSDASHRDFAQRHRLPFPLVSDRDGSIRRAFGVPKSFGLLPGRVTYVIDPHGTVQMIFNSQLHGEQHVDEALRTVRRLNGPRQAGAGS